MSRKYTPEFINFVLKLRKSGAKVSEIQKQIKTKFKLSLNKNSIIQLYKGHDTGEEDVEELSTELMKKNSRLERSKALVAASNKVLLNSHIEHEDILSSLSQMLGQVTFKTHKNIKQRKSKTPSSRTLVAHLSDMHYGLKVVPDELDGLNEYNNVVAARRTAMFIKQVAEYKPQHRDETDLVLVINGDILHGLIHDTDNDVGDLITTQYANAVSILGQAISYLAQKFKSVRIYATPGNHERIMSKNNKSRVMAKKWDSYATFVYLTLREKFKDTKNVSIEIPKTPHVSFTVQNHRMFATHGDTGFTIGNVAKAINTKAIKEKINEYNNSDLANSGKFKVFLFGHVHCAINHLLDNKSYVIINGSMSGIDHFAQGIGVVSNAPSQTFFESTKEYPVGDARIVLLSDADKDKSLDEIISPLNESF